MPEIFPNLLARRSSAVAGAAQTRRSRRAISATATPALRRGDYRGGNALPVRWPGVPALQPGDLIVIPPHAPHSCNPLHGRPRSYPHALPGRDIGAARSCRMSPAPVSPSRRRCCATALSLPSFQQVVALMNRGSLGEQLPARLAQLLHALPLSPRRRRHITPAPCCFQRAWRWICRRRRRWISWPTTARFVKRPLSAPWKQDTGLTPASLINMARIEYAKTRLRAGILSPTLAIRLALPIGSHFHKTFVSYTAATPLQYAQSRSISDISNTPLA